jgi:hypothetical protein
MMDQTSDEARLVREYSENVFRPAVLAHLATCFDGLYVRPPQDKPYFGTIGEDDADQYSAKLIEASRDYAIGFVLDQDVERRLLLHKLEAVFCLNFAKEDGMSLVLRELPHVSIEKQAVIGRVRLTRCDTATVHEFVERGRLVPVTLAQSAQPTLS